MSTKPLVIFQHEDDDPPASIAASLKRLGVPFEVRRLDLGDPLPDWPYELSGIIVMGGAMHVHHTKEHPFLVAEKKLIRRIVHEGGPVWGICLGAQLLAEAAGGDAFKRRTPEVGWTSIAKVADDPLLHGISSPFMAFNWHEYSCKLPPTAQLVARCGDGVQVFRAGGNAWGTQFHPEVDDELAPHWVKDAAKEQHHQGREWAAQLQADTDKYLPDYPKFCRKLTENFVLTTGLLQRD